MVKFNGALYSYVHNLQGDIVGIVDSVGSLVVEYKYDAWGKPTLVRTLTAAYEALAELNPFRYRGYVFDEETGLYYLQNRYYNPDRKRFVNVDAILGKQSILLNHNPNTYCNNNPVINIDIEGKLLDTIFDVFSLGASIIEVISNPTDPWNWLGLAGDIIDLIPGVTGVGEIARGVKGAAKIVPKVDNVIDGAKALRRSEDAVSALKNATGSYEIIFKSGRNYVGKGGYGRAIISATVKQTVFDDKVIFLSWKAAKTQQDAFVDEYFRMMKRGVRNANTYNRIWSPGRNIYRNILKRIF